MMSDAVARGWGGRWPAPARVGTKPAAVVLACIAALACALGVGVLINAAPRRATPPAPPVGAPALSGPLWIEIPKPVQIFSLEAPSLRRAPLAYSARRLDRWDVREDTLAFGAIAGDRPLLRLAVLRGARPDRRGLTLDNALAQLADAQELRASPGAPGSPLATRFGRFETASVGLAGRRSACDGFGLTLADPALTITGIACGAARDDLACLIDRLDLASAGEDRGLVEVFAAAELRRNPTCQGMRLGPDGVHAPWLDDKPKLGFAREGKPRRDDKPVTPRQKTRRGQRFTRSNRPTSN